MAGRLPNIEEWIKSVELSSPDNPRESDDWGLNFNPNAMATTEPQATQFIGPSLFSAPPPHTAIAQQAPPPPPHTVPQYTATPPVPTKHSPSTDQPRMPSFPLHSLPSLDRPSDAILHDSDIALAHSRQQQEVTSSTKTTLAFPRRHSKSPLPNPTAEPKQPTFDPSSWTKKVVMLKSRTFSISRPKFKINDKQLLRTSTSPSFPSPQSAPSSPVTSRNSDITTDTLSAQSERVRKTSLSHSNLATYAEEVGATDSDASSSGSMDSMRNFGRNTPSSRQSGEERSLSQNSEDIHAVLARLESPSALLCGGDEVTVSGGLARAEKPSQRSEERSPSRSPLVRQKRTSHSPSPPYSSTPSHHHHPPPSTTSPSSPSPPHALPSPPPHHHQNPLSLHQLQRHEKSQGRKFTFDTTNDDSYYRLGTQQRFLSRRSIPILPLTSPSPPSHPHKAHTITHHPPHSVSDYSSSHSSSMSHDSSGKSHDSHVIGHRSSSPVHSPTHYRSHSTGKYQLPLVTVRESQEKATSEAAGGNSAHSPFGGASGVRVGSMTQMILEHKQQKERERALDLLVAGATAIVAGGDGEQLGSDGKQVNRQDSGIGTISNASAS